jgi:hypothetical protein
VSQKKKYDLAVAYRICPRLARTPPPACADSKLKLATLCLRSFKAALGSLRVKLWAILDNCPPEYERLFAGLWDPEDLVLCPQPGIGNGGTFAKQIDILTQQDDAELVYLAEDDYFYREGKFHLALDLIRNHPDADFCTLYDHPDYYHHDFHRHKMRIKVEQGQVWKTQNGTTCTLLTRKKILQATSAVLRSYARKNSDAGMWLSLTKEHVANPYDLLTQPFSSRFRGWSLVCAWYFNWKQIIFGRRYSLWVPVPSLATHMVAGLEAPNIDWSREFERAEIHLADLAPYLRQA